MVAAELAPNEVAAAQRNDDDAAQHWYSQPRQHAFLVTMRDVDEVCYGGAQGGGKTDALLVYHIMRRSTYPGSKGLFLRRKFTDLAKAGAAIDRFLELTHGTDVKYDQNQHKAFWPNGSVTEFGYCDSNTDKANYRGAQYDDICYDEATLLEPDWILFINGRCRVRNPALAQRGMKRQIRHATNPGGPGHAYFKRRFIDLGPEVVATDTAVPPGMPPQTRAFVPAKVDDNPALTAADPAYKYSLMQLPEAERRAMLDGDWDVFEGQVFTEWRRDLHVVPALTPPHHWRRWIGFDWGYQAPMSAGWYAENPDTRQVVRYRELYLNRLTDSEQAARIASLSRGERIDYLVADPSIWSHKGGNATTAEVFQATFLANNLALPLVPADNDRLLGLRRCHDVLSWEADGSGSIARSPNFVVAANCVDFIRTIPLLQHDQRRPEDVDSGGEDHAYDDWRYAMMSRSVAVLPSEGFGTLELFPR